MNGTRILEFTMNSSLTMGPGAVARTGELLKSYGTNVVLIVTDKGIVSAGLLDQILPSLETAGVEYHVFDGVVANPRIETVDDGLRVYRDSKCNGLLAVGGGSPMDTAKSIGILATNGGCIADYEGFFMVKNPLPTLLAIPTTYGTGSEVTNAAVITNVEKKYKMLLLDDKMTPKKAILDPLLLVNLPPAIAASTGMDALTHAIESYISNAAEPISDALNIFAIKMIAENALPAMATNWDVEATANMLYASTITGFAFSNKALGMVHSLAHALGGAIDLPHGVANAILLPFVMEFNMAASPTKFADIARAMGESVDGLPMLDAAFKAVEAVRKLSRLLGIPQTLSEVNVDPETIDYMAECAVKDGNTGFNPRRGTKEDFVALFKTAM
jgi:alcohol dehydrogenase class IV